MSSYTATTTFPSSVCRISYSVNGPIAGPDRGVTTNGRASKR